MTDSAVASFLVRLKGWRLWAIFSVVTVATAVGIVSVMSLLLKGEVLSDYLITGLVTAGIVAPSSLFLLDSLLAEIARHRQAALERTVDSAEARLRVALESSDEGVLMVDADGRVLSYNRRFLELWRVPPELAARNDDSLLLAHVIDQLDDPEAFLDGVQRLYRSDSEATDQLRFRDGRVFERFTRGLALGAEKGRIWCFRDVSEQAQTRAALAEREELFRAIVSQAGDAIALIDVESTCLIEANESKCRMLGYGRDELVGQPLARIMADLSPEAVRSALAQAAALGRHAFETRYRRRDGKTIDAQVSTSALSFKGRECIVAVARDIGERKLAEAALQESRRLLQSVIDAAPVRVFWKDRDLKYLGCNPAFARDAGKSGPQEVIGHDDNEMGWAAQAALYQADDRAVMESGEPKLSYEEPQTTPDGATIWLNTSKVPLRDGSGEVIGVLGIYEDVTEHKRMAEDLRQREQYRRALLDNFPFMVWLKDEESRFLAVNQAFADTFGWPSPESLIGRSDLDITTAELASGYRDDDRAVLASGRGKQVEEIVSVRGKPRWFETYKAPVTLGGKVIGTVGFGRDISERKETENRLRMQGMVLDQIQDRVTVTDLDGRITYVNRAELSGLGRDASELLGRDVSAFGDDPRADAGQAEIVRQTMDRGAWQGRVINFDSTGSAKTIDLRTTLLRDEGGNPVAMVGIGADITERVRAERNLKLAVEVARVVLWELDIASQRISFDLATLNLLGIPQDSALKTLTGWIDRIHPEETAAFVERFQAALAPGALPFEMEYRMHVGAGVYEWIETRGSVIQRGPDGRPEVAVGTSMNVSARRQSRQALQESEERSRNLATLLRLMTDNVPDMIWAKDLDKRFLFANKAVCRDLLNAVDTEEPLGRTDMFFALRERQRHPDDPAWHTFGELCQDSDAVTLERGAASVFEEFGNLKGRMTYLDVHKAPFVNERGEVIGTVGSARDITERKRIESELDRHRMHLEDLVREKADELLATEARASRILESAADGLFGVDARGRVTFINPAARRLLGYETEAVLGRSAHELFHHSHPDGSPYPETDCAVGKAWREGRDVRLDEVIYWHADGHPVPVALGTHPMREGDTVIGAVVSIVDISMQRAAAAARENALLAAEDLARARSQFVANMSHEIRTPMNGMLGFAQIGYRHHADPDRARSAFEKILAAGNQLLGVVNDILDFSKIDAGKLHIEAVDMAPAEAIEHAVDLVAERARAKGLDLRVDIAPDLPLHCVSDPLRIGQILTNLLSNAVKFTDRGGIVVAAAREGNELVFMVTDSGIGMSDEQLAYVFNPFQQADGSTTRRFGGTGLGLAICKRLLELMHGEIRVDSRPGAGSTFEVRLPYVAGPVAPRPAAQEDRPAAAPALDGIRVLVAEDDEGSRYLLESALVEAGARATAVGNGREAVERVRADGPAAYDIVLMDIQMPELDGYEATRQIRALAPGLPVVAQTAHAFAEERERCLAAGMVDHVAKPIDLAVLAATIHRLVPGRANR